PDGESKPEDEVPSLCISELGPGIREPDSVPEPPDPDEDGPPPVGPPQPPGPLGPPGPFGPPAVRVPGPGTHSLPVLSLPESPDPPLPPSPEDSSAEKSFTSCS